MSVRRICLPEHFYVSGSDLARAPAPHGRAWCDGVEYVTDGKRFGVRSRDGSVGWLSEAQPIQLERFREDFAGVEVAALLAGLHAYTHLHPRLKFLWKDDLAALEDLHAEGEEEPEVWPLTPAVRS